MSNSTPTETIDTVSLCNQTIQIYNKQEIVLLHELVGYLAVLLGCIINLPQVYKTYKTSSVESFSVKTLFLHVICSCVLFIYAFLRNIYPNMVFNFVLGASNVTLICMYYKWKPNNKEIYMNSISIQTE